MRILFSALLIAAAPAVSRPIPDVAVSRLAADSEAHWIPFTFTPANQIAFEATLDGRTAQALLDTGASQSLLNRQSPLLAGRAVEPRGRVAAIGGSIALGWTPVRVVSFGAMTRTGGGLNVAAVPALALGNGRTVDLLIGRDMLDHYALDIDYAARRFRLLPSGRLPFTGVRVPLSVGNAPLAYVTEITVAGRHLRPMIVDTGDGTGLSLARAAWRNLPLTPPPAMTTQLAYGAGGPLVADIAVLPEVGIGQDFARQVPVWIERSGGFSDGARAAGRIGGGLLQRYRVLLDPGAGHMILAPGGIATPLPRSTSGLQLGMAGPEARVLHVMRGSPAEVSGWRVGDRICTVDRRPITATSAGGMSDWLSGTAGRVVELGLCSGETRMLTLRQFY